MRIASINCNFFLKIETKNKNALTDKTIYLKCNNNNNWMQSLNVGFSSMSIMWPAAGRRIMADRRVPQILREEQQQNHMNNAIRQNALTQKFDFISLAVLFSKSNSMHWAVWNCFSVFFFSLCLHRICIWSKLIYKHEIIGCCGANHIRIVANNDEIIV